MRSAWCELTAAEKLTVATATPPQGVLSVGLAASAEEIAAAGLVWRVLWEAIVGMSKRDLAFDQASTTCGLPGGCTWSLRASASRGPSAGRAQGSSGGPTATLRSGVGVSCCVRSCRNSTRKGSAEASRWQTSFGACLSRPRCWSACAPSEARSLRCHRWGTRRMRSPTRACTCCAHTASRQCWRAPSVGDRGKGLIGIRCSPHGVSLRDLVDAFPDRRNNLKRFALQLGLSWKTDGGIAPEEVAVQEAGMVPHV